MRRLLVVPVALALFACGPSEKDRRFVEIDERTITPSVQQWMKTHAGCPTIEVLRAEKEIAEQQKTSDPWGTPYAIACTKDAVTVSSAGPDKKPGTADDISLTTR